MPALTDKLFSERQDHRTGVVCFILPWEQHCGMVSSMVEPRTFFLHLRWGIEAFWCEMDFATIQSWHARPLSLCQDGLASGGRRGGRGDKLILGSWRYWIQPVVAQLPFGEMSIVGMFPCWFTGHMHILIHIYIYVYIKKHVCFQGTEANGGRNFGC